MVPAITYGFGCAAFLILITLTLLNRRPVGIGLLAVGAFVATALWAFSAAIQSWFMPGLANALETLAHWAWLQFLASVILLGAKTGERPGRVLSLLVAGAGAAALANDLRFLFSAASMVDFEVSQIFMRILIAILGILMVENLFRNSVPSRRWHIFPLCLGVGSLFAYDLFVFVESLITHRVDISLLTARGIVLTLMVPLLIVTMSRNQSWNVEIHISRRVVLHTATLTAGGIFLLAAAGAASLFGMIPGEWGPVLEIAFFFGSVLLLLTVVSTASMRSRLRRTIGEYFFSRRYDYREEWMRFVEELASVEDIDPLQIRVIRAVANIVDSPGGALWLEEHGNYKIADSLNMKLDRGAVEPAEGRFIGGFKNGQAVQDLRDPAVIPGLPDWAKSGSAAWLAVPLNHKGGILGFIVLPPPRAPLTLNWESFDLLLAVGRQGASYLAEDHATRRLIDAQAIMDYNKRFAFIVHDVKNISSQLGMMVSNVRRYSEHPEFRADMIRTLENSVERLNGLLSKLRTGGGAGKQREILDPVPVIKSVVGDIAHADVVVETEVPESSARVRMEPQELHSVLNHLITNAIEASPAGSTVRVRLSSNSARVVIDVEDRGPGMDPAFVRNELFTPLRTTKTQGHGIGAFQAREIVRAAGGDLEVISAVGRGTTMRIMIPNVAEDAAMSTSSTAAV